MIVYKMAKAKKTDTPMSEPAPAQVAVEVKKATKALTSKQLVRFWVTLIHARCKWVEKVIDLKSEDFWSFS